MYEQWTQDFFNKVSVRKEFDDFIELKEVILSVENHYAQN